MKKSTFVFAAILCAGLAQISHAQPTTYETALAAGKSDFKIEKYEAATKDAAESLAVAASPEETGDALMLLGETFYRRKMYGEAQTQWAKMLELRGTDDDDALHTFAHLGYARSYDAQGQWDKAIPEHQLVRSQFEAHIKTDGDANTNAVEAKQLLAPFDFALANAYSHTKQYDLAQQQLKQIIQYSDGDSGYRLLALIKRGQIDTVQRDFKGALDSFNQVLKLAGLTPKSSADKVTGRLGELIPLLQSLVKSQVGAGQPNDGKIKVEIVLPPEFDEASNTVSKIFLDEVVGQFLTNSDEE